MLNVFNDKGALRSISQRNAKKRFHNAICKWTVKKTNEEWSGGRKYFLNSSNFLRII